jgi:hypothetical protein
MRRRKLITALGAVVVLLVSAVLVYAADTVSTPDSTGNVGRWSSLALDDNNYPVVAYYDATNQDLKVLHCGNTTCSSANNIETITGTGTVKDYSIAIQLDDDGYPLVAFTTTDYKIKLLHCNDVNCDGGNETVNVIDDAATYGNGHYIGFYLSMVLDDDGYPAISYQHALPTFYLYTPKIARCDDVDCSSPTVQLLDEAGLGERSGFGNSLALDSSEYPVLSFTDADVWVIHCDEVDCTGTNSVEDIGNSAGGPYSNRSLQTAMALDSSGYPIVAFHDEDLHLRVVHCNDADCDGGNESSVVIDDVGPTGLYVSMVLNGSGYPVIAYHSHTFGDLKVYTCDDTDCDSGTSFTIERPNHAGAYTSIQLNPTTGNPVISHNYQDSADLGVAVCDTGATPGPCAGIVDSDNDGCSDAQEAVMTPAMNATVYDFFDTPDENGLRDREIISGTGSDSDVQRVLDRGNTHDDDEDADDDLYEPPSASDNYHPAFDVNSDGDITLFGDVLAVINQVGLDCS